MAYKRKAKVSPSESKKLRQTKEARVEEEVATSVEKAASPPRNPVTQEVAAADDDGGEARFLGEPMEDEEARKQYSKRYVGKLGFGENVGDLGSLLDLLIVQGRCSIFKVSFCFCWQHWMNLVVVVAWRKPKMNGQNNSNDDEDIIQARRPYTIALVDGINYDLYDDAHVFVSLHDSLFVGIHLRSIEVRLD
ncbi:hypothetical protein DVH24_038060 [Malus domestica]|uniref:Uncharacterized protein n=1 Tax=Malus domestica TaxID=3750 RepID=A0A498K8T2_MALDO|nr:hypothetical protein DVH24_038060 [Malus domestica]